jgi:nitronate monooxygenase
LDKFISEIKTAETIISEQGQQTQVLPIGVGFLVWKLNESPNSTAQKALAYVLDRGVKAIWLSFGEDIQAWIQHIREHSGPHKPLIVVLVSNTEEASLAVAEWNVDIVVAQGTSEMLLL